MTFVVSRYLCTALLFVLVPSAVAIDNGLGVTPPRGWRSWNQFQCDINQSLIEDIYGRMAQRTRSVDGKPTSLLDLGYKTAGIDDCWQKCNSGPGGKGFHNASGYPIVDTAAFPDMRAMTSKAKSLGSALEPAATSAQEVMMIPFLPPRD